MKGSYDDLLNLPHHVSRNHPQMPMEERAAQFLPFAALTGYEDILTEAARLTEERPDLDGDRNVSQNAGQNKRIFISWFLFRGK